MQKRSACSSGGSSRVNRPRTNAQKMAARHHLPALEHHRGDDDGEDVEDAQREVEVEVPLEPSQERTSASASCIILVRLEMKDLVLDGSLGTGGFL